MSLFPIQACKGLCTKALFFKMWNAKYETLLTMKNDIIFGCILGCVLIHRDKLVS